MRNLRSLRRALAGWSLAVIAGAAPLAAQAVRGAVVMPDESTPAAGVIVVFESAPGVVAHRALTDERGAFTARLAAAGEYRTRVLRVGYRPSEGPTLRVEGMGTTTVRIVLSVTPVTLPAVSVRSADVCRGDRAGGAVVAEVWEEARKALMASALSDGSDPLIAEWVEYERTLDASGRVVRNQRIRSTRSATTHAFRSAPWSELAESGYVVDTDDGTVFHAPDADVLLSDSFASLHCFHVEPPGPDRENQVGVGFRPASERRHVSDIEGTFWIDRASGELRLLEFRYTNLPSVADRAAPGGTVEFLRLPSGSWLVNRWHIRMPQIAVTAPTTIRGRGVRVVSSTRELSALRIVGGEVSTVRRTDSTLYRAQGAGLHVRVTSPDGQLSAADTRVTLEGTDYELITERDGSGGVEPILPGRYRLRVQSPLMDSLGVHADPVDVSVDAADRRAVTVPLPEAAALLRGVCGATATAAQGAHLRGVVVDSAGLPVADASVSVSWQSQLAVVRDRLTWNDQVASTRSDSLGYWQLCAVPRDVGLAVRARAGTGIGRASLRVPPKALFAATRVEVQPEPSASGGADARVLVVVTDSVAGPVRDATIEVGESANPARRGALRVRSDANGYALLPPLRPGEVTVSVRKVGYAAGAITATVERGENTLPIQLAGASTPTLAEVRVVGDRPVSAKHTDFETRRARGDATAVVTLDEIERRAPVSTWQLLTRLPSITVLDSLGYVYARSSRMSTIMCWPRIAVDGLVQPGRPNLAQLPPPSEIFGIEVFAGGASMPLPMAGEGDERWCGLIAIWTR